MRPPDFGGEEDGRRRRWRRGPAIKQSPRCKLRFSSLTKPSAPFVWSFFSPFSTHSDGGPRQPPQTRAERQRWRTLLGPRHAQDPQLSQAARRPGAGTMPRCYLVKKAATKHPAGPASSGRWPYREPLSPSEAETAPCAPLFGDQAADERPAIVTSAAFGRTSPTTGEWTACHAGHALHARTPPRAAPAGRFRLKGADHP
ncbi:hypothetical protein HPB50_010661 [Hyalomma asiaticum]|uniref:Uncharacterized protein n=1 Tax=Hyalomma asiaticum TaxID=266040 RepID=A0ACB7TI65_HYAAI|nr:hypothetical protein HPB50_010661 [Hyalomma asiaticum]